jgi:uncharacterized RDD family membrane protein YckC
MAYAAQPDPTAVFGRRIIAFLVDALIILVPLALLTTADFEYHEATTLQQQGVSGKAFCEPRLDAGDPCIDLSEVEGIERVYFSDGFSGRTQLAFWVVPIALLVVLPAFTGWTVGKAITGIRVVRHDGRPPGLLKAFVRWLLWIVDGFPYILPLVGFIVGISTVGHRRVGDMGAQTLVVDRSAAGAPIVVPGLTPAPAAEATSWAAVPEARGTSAATPAPPSAPQWDEARGTYIQWDPAQAAWVQWDEATQAWARIPGQ